MTETVTNYIIIISAASSIKDLKFVYDTLAWAYHTGQLSREELQILTDKMADRFEEIS